MPSTYATAFAAHHARGSTLSHRDTMVHRPTMLRPRDTMIHRPTMLRHGDTMVRHGDTMVRHIDDRHRTAARTRHALNCALIALSPELQAPPRTRTGVLFWQGRSARHRAALARRLRLKMPRPVSCVALDVQAIFCRRRHQRGPKATRIRLPRTTADSFHPLPL